MASFVIHHIVGERLLNLLQEKYGLLLSEEERGEFLLSNLIVDSSKLKFKQEEGETEKDAKRRHRLAVQDEKVATHFRGSDDLDKCIQVPKLELFTEKYSSLLEGDLKALGYLFHLYTDKEFFDHLFTDTFDTLDENGNYTDLVKDTKSMLVKKNGENYLVNEFWDISNPKSIYNDYTVMNKMLLEYFNSSFDVEKLMEAAETFENPGIEEVDFRNIISIIKKTARFIAESYEAEGSNLNIFSEERVKEFVESTAESFIEKYGKYFNINPKQLVLEKRSN